ncbi:lipid A biosynthesis acyltransferase [Flavobacteriales bacterium]|nr:lipid A biosynthesis acyltransferase [Flavobacteriales bacterium]
MSGWSGKSRGNALGYWFFIFFLKNFGLAFTYVFLHLVVVYFFLFSWESSKWIYHYYRERLGFEIWKSVRSIYKTYYVFGQVIIDKVALASGFEDSFKLKHKGAKFIRDMVENKTGGILISGHMGNWEIASHLMRGYGGKVNVVMFDEEHQKIKKHIDATTGGRKFNVIPIKDDISHVFLISKAIMNKELVCIHGDRYREGMRTMKNDFLNKEANFPFGPFGIAAKFDVPKVFVYGFKTGTYNYSFYSSEPIFGKAEPEFLLSKYVNEMDKMVRKYPSQWFNFYDFWRS